MVLNITLIFSGLGEMDIAKEILYCDEKHQALIVTFRAQVTFKEFVSIIHPEWNKDDIAAWAKKIAMDNF